MEIDENAPGNISQKGVSGGTDNETGHDPKRSGTEAPFQLTMRRLSTKK